MEAVRRGRGAWRLGGTPEARPTVSDSNGVAKLNLSRPGNMSATGGGHSHFFRRR
jgi:hypothetical protein